jgi:cation-transporting P-type ATPase J
VLATMPPLLSAIANAGRHGVLIKSAVVMEKFGKATVVAFDKTGTLTEGAPRVAELAPVPATGIHADEALTLAAAAERSSEHPIARAVVALARERDLDLPAASGFTSTPGQGVSATVTGRRIRVGSPGLLSAGDGLDEETIQQARRFVRQFETGGRTAVVVLVDDVPVAVLAIADRLRPGARETVIALTALTGHSPVLLTGDNQRAAEALASEVGITDVRAGLLPAGKVDAVRALQADGHRVLLVGDGVNDAPAMATAHLGVAMGRQGSDLALETADAVIVRDELDTLPSMIGLSRRAHRVVTANLAIAATVIVLLVGWDLVGTLPLPLGVAGHEGSTVIVGLNGLRLLHSRAWRRAQGGRSQPRSP